VHGAFAAKSGWGKSWHLQAWIERNAPRYDYFVCLDYADEYRGLVKSGLAVHYIVGPNEAAAFGVEEWTIILRENPHLILARHELGPETWREDVAAPVIQAARRLAQSSGSASSLTVIDEAHWVAPQSGALPDVVKGMATTGRGEGSSSLWATQRPAEFNETMLGNMMFQILGGFTSSADMDKVRRIAEYPADVHNPQKTTLPALPDALQVDGESIPLRRFTEGGGEDEHTIGSEWVYSDDSGDLRRIDTRNIQMDATHYGAEGMKLLPPEERPEGG